MDDVITNPILKKLAGAKVLVIGDVVLDHFVWGEVDRISPEAPVPVVHVNQNEERAGGACNVALNIASLGAQCTVMGLCGDDEAAQGTQRPAESRRDTHRRLRARDQGDRRAGRSAQGGRRRDQLERV